ncbi:MAG: FxLYD domain-containing protein [Candidatus Bathyarchaeota archaeon]|nr:FxLYD domain-containing protein [Candidatus Bathyarchaeota archaeon]
MKNKSSICILLLLVISSLTVITSEGASAQTENVKILTYSYFMDMIGNIVVVGEVQNVGSSVIDYVIVSGAITGSDGSYVEAGNRVWATNLLPGEKAPFYLDFLAQYTNSYTWYGVQISDITLGVYKAPATTQYQYQEVEVITDEPAPTSSGEYWVNGELKNNGGQTASNVTVIATFYNSSGSVITAGYTNPISSLAAGATNSFKVAAFDLNQSIVSSDLKIAGYSLLVQVGSPMQTGTAPIANSTVVPVATTPPTSNVSQTNTDQNLIYVAVVLAVVIAVIAASVLLKRRKPASKPTPKKQVTKNKKHK